MAYLERSSAKEGRKLALDYQQLPSVQSTSCGLARDVFDDPIVALGSPSRRPFIKLFKRLEEKWLKVSWLFGA